MSGVVPDTAEFDVMHHSTNVLLLYRGKGNVGGFDVGNGDGVVVVGEQRVGAHRKGKGLVPGVGVPLNMDVRPRSSRGTGDCHTIGHGKIEVDADKGTTFTNGHLTNGAHLALFRTRGVTVFPLAFVAHRARGRTTERSVLAGFALLARNGARGTGESGRAMWALRSRWVGANGAGAAWFGGGVALGNVPAERHWDCN